MRILNIAFIQYSSHTRSPPAAPFLHTTRLCSCRSPHPRPRPRPRQRRRRAANSRCPRPKELAAAAPGGCPSGPRVAGSRLHAPTRKAVAVGRRKTLPRATNIKVVCWRFSFKAFLLQSCVQFYTDSGEKVWEGCGKIGKGPRGPQVPRQNTSARQASRWRGFAKGLHRSRHPGICAVWSGHPPSRRRAIHSAGTSLCISTGTPT